MASAKGGSGTGSLHVYSGASRDTSGSVQAKAEYVSLVVGSSQKIGGTINLGHKLCPKGKWSSQEGLSAELCQSCSAGKWSSVTGLMLDKDCLPCSPGRYSRSIGLAEICEAWTFLA